MLHSKSKLVSTTLLVLVVAHIIAWIISFYRGGRFQQLFYRIIGVLQACELLCYRQRGINQYALLSRWASAVKLLSRIGSLWRLILQLERIVFDDVMSAFEDIDESSSTTVLLLLMACVFMGWYFLDG